MPLAAVGSSLAFPRRPVLVDRIIALLGLSILVAAFGMGLSAVIGGWAVIGFGSLCLLGVATLYATFHFAPRMHHYATGLPLAQRIVYLVHFSLRVVRSLRTALTTLLLAVAVHLLSFSSFFLIARSIGMAVDVITFFALASVLTLVQVVPTSISGWAVREAAAVTLFGLVGVDQGTALLASVILGLAYAVVNLPGAFFWPFLRKAARSPLGRWHR
jgi:uncharacterized membrane protein YbhN (UPF0104 family)